MISLKDFKNLYNGVKIPCVGYGTYKSPSDIYTENMILKSIELGYRHIDTASFYNNENCVGRAVKNCGIKRDELFITTKLWNDVRGYKNTLEAFYKSLELLNLEYVDLYLIHWPIPIMYRNNYFEMNLETYKAFEELYSKKLIRAIGVSNFKKHHLQPFIKEVKIKPMVNQIEINPAYADEATIEYCNEENIIIEAWSPLMRGRNLNHYILNELAKKYNKTAAQICLRWSLQRGFIPLVKTLHENRLIENKNIFDFEMNIEDIYLINSIQQLNLDRVGSDPDNALF